jgi:hypothetical protein
LPIAFVLLVVLSWLSCMVIKQVRKISKSNSAETF